MIVPLGLEAKIGLGFGGEAVETTAPHLSVPWSNLIGCVICSSAIDSIGVSLPFITDVAALAGSTRPEALRNGLTEDSCVAEWSSSEGGITGSEHHGEVDLCRRGNVFTEHFFGFVTHEVCELIL